MAIIQCYAPTSAAPDSEVDEFYDDLQSAQNEFQNCSIVITMVLLIAKLV
jgi:hypothetical protein